MWSAGACSRCLPLGLARACSSDQPHFAAVREVVILSEVPRFFSSRGLCAARDAVEGPLLD